MVIVIVNLLKYIILPSFKDCLTKNYNYNLKLLQYLKWSHILDQGRNWGGALGVHAPFFTSHFFREMFINRGATHLTLGLWLLLSQPFYQKYTCAPLTKLPSCAPVLNESVRKTMTVNFLKVSSEVVPSCSFERTLVAWICFWILALLKMPIQVSLFIELLFTLFTYKCLVFLATSLAPLMLG